MSFHSGFDYKFEKIKTFNWKKGTLQNVNKTLNGWIQ